MKTPALFICIVFVAVLVPTRAATNAVILGNNFQQAVDAAAAGDTLLVEPGGYEGSVIITKNLNILAAAAPGGPKIQFIGPVRIQHTGVTHIQQSQFNAQVNTINGSVTFLNSDFKAPLGSSGGKVTIKSTTLREPVNLTNTTFEALRMTLMNQLNATTNGVSPQMVVVQSQIGSFVVTGYKMWFGYNDGNDGVSGTFALTLCDSYFIGNRFITGTANPTRIMDVGMGSFRAYNNLIVNGTGGYGNNAVSLDSVASAELVNNSLLVRHTPGPAAPYAVASVRIANARGPINFRNNLIYCDYGEALNCDAVSAPFTSIRYCDVFGVPGAAGTYGGTLPTRIECISLDPMLDFSGNYPFDPESPLINRGSTEAIAKNKDGSRNTIGHLGGPFYNPANKTNDAPMVFLLAGPQTVLKGTTSTIQISAAGSAGQ